MKKILIISLTFILFGFVACDRFEHNLAPDTVEGNWISDFFVTFADSIETILPAENVSGIMNFFHNDYSNDGLSKTDVENFYKSFSYVNMPLTFETTLIDTNGLAIEWRLLVTNPDSGSTFMDTLITDTLIETDDSYKFYGNQAALRNVVVELFTGQWCSNCPNAEEALHNLRMQYGNRFSYVEYHVGDQLAGDFGDLFSYYPNGGTLPFGIVNGNAHIVYSAPSIEEVQTEVETAIIPLLQEPLNVLLSDVQTNLTDSLLTGSVQIEVDPSLPTDNLTLVAVLMEDYNDDYLNHNDEPHHNIALKRTSQVISMQDRSNPVTFEITGLDELPTWYSNILPADLTLVIWVQTMDTPYDQNTCAVYNVIEIPL